MNEYQKEAIKNIMEYIGNSINFSEAKELIIIILNTFKEEEIKKIK